MTELRKTVFVTGSGGQLGSEIHEICHRFQAYRFVFLRHENLDIGDPQDVERKLAPAMQDVIINAAAYTSVDRAEDEPENARKANTLGPENLAKLAAKSGCLLIHISTNYVFDGESPRPYKEGGATSPRNMYGVTKLEGEQAILRAQAQAIIIRTSWVYSSFGHNFVKTMLDVGRKRGNVSVIFEQSGSPTYARDLAEVILKIMQSLPDNSALPRIYHYSNEGFISWYDFAKAIFEIANVECQVVPIEIEDYPLRALRPVNSVLNKGKIKRDFDVKIPYWRDSLRACLTEIEMGHNK
jgi:dTDP-4-dehydrorhamnose reductase